MVIERPIMDIWQIPADLHHCLDMTVSNYIMALGI
jgi:cupin superfamily acireductone dioxygenase involved in methionine salvage